MKKKMRKVHKGAKASVAGKKGGSTGTKERICVNARPCKPC